MKQIILLITFLILFQNCFSQNIKTKINDLYKLNEHKEQYLGKPLKELLKDINIPIQSFSAWGTDNPKFSPSRINFWFNDKKQADSLYRKRKLPLRITVRIADYIPKDFYNRPDSIKFKWTKADEKQFENLLIEGFGVYGNTILDY